jgi:threonine synthase
MYRCVDCGRTYPEWASTPYRCDCGGPFRFADPPVPGHSGGPPAVDRGAGVWAFDDLLPVERAVTLGEGWTPLVDAPDRGVTYKLEGFAPTASFKDRGAAVTLSHAVALGVDRVVEDSSGNAGAAIAAYAARAGLDAEIYVPADAKAGKLTAIERTGATVRRVEGDRAAVTEACLARVAGTSADSTDAWYASHAWQPSFLEGTATVAYEIAAQRDWAVPDAVVAPLGHGTLFLGASLGFERLHEAGWTDDVPRLYGVQAAGAAPVVAARHGESAAAGGNNLADGIQIRDPARHGEIVAALDATGGDVVAVDRETTAAEHRRLGREGFHVEPTCAVAPAALDTLYERGAIDTDEDVVVPLTGHGLAT